MYIFVHFYLMLNKFFLIINKSNFLGNFHSFFTNKLSRRHLSPDEAAVQVDGPVFWREMITLVEHTKIFVHSRVLRLLVGVADRQSVEEDGVVQRHVGEGRILYGG